MTNTYNKPRRSCPICDSTGRTVFYQSFAQLGDASVIDRYDVSVCRDCDMLFANNILSQAEFDEYYFNSNKYETTKVTAIWNEYHQEIYDYVRRLDKSTRIADFGCGMGGILRKLHNEGFYNLYALDASTSNCIALSKEGIRTLNKSVFDVDSCDYPDKLEVIILAAVLEHIVDLHGFMHRILSVLQQKGTLVICVPTIDEAYGLHAPLQEFSIEHINYFNNKSLCALMGQYGLEPVAQLDESPILTLVFRSGADDYATRYISNSLKAIESALEGIDNLIALKTPVAVWGVGSLTRYLLANTRFLSLNITTFIDSDANYHDKKLIGKRVLSPIMAVRCIGSNPIIIATYNANEAITKTIREELKLDNEIIYLL